MIRHATLRLGKYSAKRSQGSATGLTWGPTWGPLGDRHKLQLLSELAAVKRGVEPSRSEKLVMRAALDDATIAHDQDAIGVSDRAQAMRDHKARTALHELIERGLDLELGARIDGARSLIEQQNRRIGKQDREERRVGKECRL